MATSEEQVEHVRALVAGIPPGRVVTYGDLAAAAGLSTPRTVGWIMRTDSADLPWHRVVGAGGKLVTATPDRQARLLADEGATVRDGRVDLAATRFPLS